MDWFDTTLTPVFLRHTWQLTALILVVAILVHRLGRKRPHLAYALWLVVIAKCITPPIWTSPSGVFCWLQPPQVQTTVPQDAVFRSPEIQVHFQPDPNTARPVASSSMTAAPAVAAGTTTSTKKSQPATGNSYLARLGLVWMLGAVAWMLVQGLRCVACYWRMRRAPGVMDPKWNAAAQRLASRLGLRRRVRVWITHSSVGPAVVGLWRPTIVLPKVITQQRRPAELEAIMAHELIHVRRGDLWLGWTQMLVRSVWWFHPLVWWAMRKLSQDVERCCDEAVLAELRCKPQDYARSLLEILERKRMLRSMPAFPGVRAVEVTSRRLERIMSLRQGCQRRTPWWCWSIAAVMSLVWLPGAGMIAAQTVQDFPTLPLVGSTPSAAATAAKRVKRKIQLIDESEQPAEWMNNDASRQHLREMLTSGLAHGSQVTLQGMAVQFNGTQHDLNTVMDRVKLFRQHGLAQVLLEVQLVSAEKKHISRLIPEWTLVPRALRSQPMRGNLRPLPDRDSSRATRTATSTEQPLVTLCCELDDEQAKQLMQALREDDATTVLSAPTLCMFNGRSGSIEHGTHRPFVVGIENGQPLVQEFFEGQSLRIRPWLRAEDRIWIDLDFVHSHIRSVTDRKIRTGIGGQRATIQIPRVSKASLESSFEVREGHNLVLGGVPDPTDDKKEMLLVVRARKITPHRLEEMRKADTTAATGESVSFDVSQVVIDTTFMRVGKEFFDADTLSRKPAALTDIERFFMQQATESMAEANVRPGPRVTVQNGRQGGFELDAGNSDTAAVTFKPTIKDDGTIQLRVVTGGKPLAQPDADLKLQKNGSLLLDVTGTIDVNLVEAPQVGVPIPGVAKAFKNSRQGKGDRLLLLLTPRILEE